MTANKRYSKECKQRMLESLMPPKNKIVPQASKEAGINCNTLNTWIKRVREQGENIPHFPPSHQRKWRKENMLNMVMDIYALNEAELSTYSRKHGL